MADSSQLPRYDWHQSYDWNYEHVPSPVSLDESSVPGNWNYCGLPISSPLAISAGPLLNGKWILYYASLGFDALTYKTVRSRFRASYPLPNLQPVNAGPVNRSDKSLDAISEMHGSWAVSFGMPSKEPKIWRADIEATRRALPKNKVLSVSVVATPEAGWTQDDIANDFAQCAQWAIESGADCIEANFSCPNVASADGQLYQQPSAAGLIAAQLRQAAGKKPLLIKIGHITDETLAIELCKSVAPHVNALVMVNCIAAPVMNGQKPLFNGQKRGIAGDAIHDAALDQVKLFMKIIREHNFKLRVIGNGGISSAEHVHAHLRAGANAVQLATAPMTDPQIGLKIRRELASVL